MGAPPRYAGKDRYRTRQSGGELDAVDDMSDTGLDRIVPDLDRLRRERDAARREEELIEVEPTRSAGNPRLVLVLVAALSVTLVAVAALSALLLTR